MPTLAVLAALAVLVGAGLAVWHGSDTTTPAGAATRPVPAHPSAATATGTEPGTLILSTRTISLGPTEPRADFDVANSGDLPTQYQVSTRARWLRLSSIGGSLGATDSVRVTVLADRTAVPAGTSSGVVHVTWDGGSATVRVSLDPPH